MTGIRDLGPSGKAVFKTAQDLKKAGLIDRAQFRELTNKRVGPQDIAIGRAALEKIEASTPNAEKLMFSIPKMNDEIVEMQQQGLGQGNKKAHHSKGDGDGGDGFLGGLDGFIGRIFGSLGGRDNIADVRRDMRDSIVRNISA